MLGRRSNLAILLVCFFVRPSMHQNRAGSTLGQLAIQCWCSMETGMIKHCIGLFLLGIWVVARRKNLKHQWLNEECIEGRNFVHK